MALVNKFAENLSTDEYIQHVKRIQDDDGSDTVSCLKFIKRVEEVGLDNARKEYGDLIKDPAEVRTLRVNLLTMASQESNSAKNKVEEHIRGIVKQYKETDFETYTGKIKINKAMRSSTNINGKD